MGDLVPSMMPPAVAGRRITCASLANDHLILTLDNGQKLDLWDDGALCCERRYVTTDDPLDKIVGGALLRIEAREGPETEDEDGDPHEQMFVEVATDKGFITLVTHNEHNGYYGGFELRINVTEAA